MNDVLEDDFGTTLSESALERNFRLSPSERSRSRGGRCRVYRPKRRNWPLEERMGPEVGGRRWSPELLHGENQSYRFGPKSPSGKAFQAEIDRIPIAPRVRRTRERLPSDGCIESELPRSRLTGTVVPFASDTALT